MSQTNFYREIAENILRQGRFGALSDEQMKQYAPPLAALIEERIGIELLPKLNDEQTEQFVGLVENEQTTPKAWHDFWSAAVPNFEEVVAGVAGEFMASLAG